MTHKAKKNSRFEPISEPNIGEIVTEEIRNSKNRVDPSANGYHAFWSGRIVYENGRVKRFETEREAWEFLNRCDAAGKIIHWVKA